MGLVGFLAFFKGCEAQMDRNFLKPKISGKPAKDLLHKGGKLGQQFMAPINLPGGLRSEKLSVWTGRLFCWS